MAKFILNTELGYGNNGMNGDVRPEGYRNFSKECRKKIRKLILKAEQKTGKKGVALVEFLNETYQIDGALIWPRNQEKPETIYASGVWMES